MRHWMKTARIKRNGEPDTYEIAYGPAEKAVATAVVALLVAAVGQAVILYREVGQISERQIQSANRAEEGIRMIREHADLPFHPGVYRHFLTREEYFLFEGKGGKR